MISFIIVGRNEGWKLSICIQSVFDTIKFNNLTRFEVIYVDSRSTDDSVERAKKFSPIKIIQLTGLCNSAIGRNVGVSESKGKVLFFIDGDMELMKEFLPLVYEEDQGLKYLFVSGQLKNFNYDRNRNFINNSWQYKDVLKGDRFYSTSGGIMIIEKKLWKSVGGMDNRFKRGQDMEIALRLAKRGNKILRKKEIIANHHTIAYTHHTRIWKTIFTGDMSYSNSFLIRKQFLNKYAYLFISRNFYTLVSLIFFGLLAIVLSSFYLLSGYLLTLFLKTYRSNFSNLLRAIELIFFYFIRDLAFIFYLFVPMKKMDASHITYTILNENFNVSGG